MKRFTILAMAAILFAIAAPVASADQMANGPYHIMITLNGQNNSGESGAATLAQDNKDVLVYVHVVGGGPTQPIHIHTGTCANLNPVPKYPLTTLQDGDSFTRLKDMQLDSLLSSPFAINAHKSPNEGKIYVACGNITKS